MAASIPVLRVLFNEVKARSQRYYYGASGNGGTASEGSAGKGGILSANSASDNRSRLGSSRIGGGGKGYSSTAVVSADKSRFQQEGGPLNAYPPMPSDLQHAAGRDSPFILHDVEGKIVRTNEVEIAYYDKGDSPSVKKA